MAPDERSISSLVLTLASGEAVRAEVLGALAARGDLELGELAGCWVPAVLESANPADAVREIGSLAGVAHVEVIFVEVATVSA